MASGNASPSHRPEEATTIADRINQKCHHDWIDCDVIGIALLGVFRAAGHCYAWGH